MDAGWRIPVTGRVRSTVPSAAEAIARAGLERVGTGISPLRSTVRPCPCCSHDAPRPPPVVLTTKRRRRRQVRKDFAADRRRIVAAGAAATKSHRKAATERPDAPAPTKDAEQLARSLRRLAKQLRSRADGDAAITAAARGVAQIAESYELLAKARRTTDVQKAYGLIGKSAAALDRAEREKARAGDAWPL